MLILTLLRAQLTVTSLSRSLSTVMLTPQPAEADWLTAPITPVAARAEAATRVLIFMMVVVLSVNPPAVPEGSHR